MRARFVALLAGIVIAIAVSASLVDKPLGTTPVVVELFTSQGCSSCPPADELIRTLSHDASLRGKVIPLAFHVDYWNHLGWTDPFSSRAWSQRQMAYTEAMRLNSAYTPQAVVNGSTELVGSRRGALLSAIGDASRRTPVGRISVQATRDRNRIAANVHAEAPAGYDVMLVVFQNGVTTKIDAGENGGRMATDDAIVRRLQRVSGETISVPIDSTWRDVGVAVFLQDRQTLRIVNAAVWNDQR